MDEDFHRHHESISGLVLAAAVMIAVALAGYGAVVARAFMVAHADGPTACQAGGDQSVDTCSSISASASVRSARAAEEVADIAAWQLALGVAGLAGAMLTILFAYHAWREARRSADAAFLQIENSRREAKEQAEQFAQQLGAAKTAAEAAKLSADALVTAERAYVFFHNAIPVTDGNGNVERFDIEWKNWGKTPAFITKISFECRATPEPTDPRQIYGLPVPAGAVIGTGEKWRRGSVADAQQRISELRAGHSVYLCGQITYRDVHQAERHSWFTRQFTGSQFILGIYVDPTLNGFD